MCIEDPLSPFAAELRSICSKISPAHSSGIVYDEEAQFQSHLTSLADSGQYSDEHLEKLQDAHERVTEQYSEDGVVSLHMSDGERFVVDGTLEEDVTEEYLPLSRKSYRHGSPHTILRRRRPRNDRTFHRTQSQPNLRRPYR